MQADLVPLPVTLLDRFARAGVDVRRLLAHAKLARSRFEGSRAYVTTGELFALWEAVAEVGGSPEVGLLIGAETLPHQYNVASMAALHSASLGEALEKLARYKRLVCPEQITIEVRGGEARVRFEWLLSAADPPAPLIDGIFAGVLSVARRGTSKPIAPRRIELTRRRAHEDMLRRHFACELRFDAPHDLLVFDEAAMIEPFVTHNAELLEVLLPGLEAQLHEEGGARTLADDVRATLGRRICGERPAVDKIARALGMSGRTLQRRLGELGTTYQALLDDVRRRSARRLLANTDLDAAEVAFLLGFEELNSFTRAFHGWEGTTPNRWRTGPASVQQAKRRLA